MKRMLIAVLVAAAPAVARAQSHDGWDHGSWSDEGQASDGYGYGDDEQQPPPPSDWSQPDDDSWQSSDEDSRYAAESGPTFDEFRRDSGLRWNGEWMQTPEYGMVWRPTR